MPYIPDNHYQYLVKSAIKLLINYMPREKMREIIYAIKLNYENNGIMKQIAYLETPMTLAHIYVTLCAYTRHMSHMKYNSKNKRHTMQKFNFIDHAIVRRACNNNSQLIEDMMSCKYSNDEGKLPKFRIISFSD